MEDVCDALGFRYLMPRELAESLRFSENNPGRDDCWDRGVRWTGTYGVLSTKSYPLLHLTMGEGSVFSISRDVAPKVFAESYLVCGRECWILSSIVNTFRPRPQLHLQPPGLQPPTPQSAGDYQHTAAAAA